MTGKLFMCSLTAAVLSSVVSFHGVWCCVFPTSQYLGLCVIFPPLLTLVYLTRLKQRGKWRAHLNIISIVGTHIFNVSFVIQVFPDMFTDKIILPVIVTRTPKVISYFLPVFDLITLSEFTVKTWWICSTSRLCKTSFWIYVCFSVVFKTFISSPIVWCCFCPPGLSKINIIIGLGFWWV